MTGNDRKLMYLIGKGWAPGKFRTWERLSPLPRIFSLAGAWLLTLFPLGFNGHKFGVTANGRGVKWRSNEGTCQIVQEFESLVGRRKNTLSRWFKKEQIWLAGPRLTITTRTRRTQLGRLKAVAIDIYFGGKRSEFETLISNRTSFLLIK